jgi:hypothetical protein
VAIGAVLAALVVSRGGRRRVPAKSRRCFGVPGDCQCSCISKSLSRVGAVTSWPTTSASASGGKKVRDIVGDAKISYVRSNVVPLNSDRLPPGPPRKLLPSQVLVRSQALPLEPQALASARLEAYEGTAPVVLPGVTQAATGTGTATSPSLIPGPRTTTSTDMPVPVDHSEDSAGVHRDCHTPRPDGTVIDHCSSTTCTTSSRLKSRVQVAHQRTTTTEPLTANAVKCEAIMGAEPTANS